MNKEAEQRPLHRIANVHNFLQIWQDSRNQYATQMKSRAQNRKVAAVGDILDTEEMLTAFLFSLST